jgi:hypothetical protein
MERKDVLPEFCSLFLVLGDKLLINPMDDVHLAFRHLLIFKNFVFQCFHPGFKTPFSLRDLDIFDLQLPSLSNNSFGCIFSSLIYRLMVSARGFSSDGPDEDIATSKLGTIP